MAKRTFLQLCHTYNPVKKHVGGWLISRKLDGMRVFWDGGLTRGMRVEDVPFANKVKDYRFIEEKYATGLWSRTGKAKFAPDNFLNKLPNIPLDGELYLGPGRFQELMSIVNTHSGTDWSDVRLMVLDSPSYEEIFKNGIIEIRMGSIKYDLSYSGITEWAKNRAKQLSIQSLSRGKSFELTQIWLKQNIKENSTLRILPQCKLPYNAVPAIEAFFDLVLKDGDEGVILRSPDHSWINERTHNCLKYKPFSDDEGMVIGYQWGRQTEHGSKLLGKMGALILNYKGKQLKLSGFTDDDRELLPKNQCIFDEWATEQGKEVSGNWYNPKFPIGSIVSFKYRELSDDGIPKDARYFRKRED